VKTNVVFLTRGTSDQRNTQGVWVYDMRANMDAFGKTRPLTVADFADFERAYGDDRYGRAARADQGPDGRFRYFDRAQIAARGDNLDISWLKDTSDAPEDALTEPEELAAAMAAHLRAALAEIQALTEELGGTAPEVAA